MAAPVVSQFGVMTEVSENETSPAFGDYGITYGLPVTQDHLWLTDDQEIIVCILRS